MLEFQNCRLEVELEAQSPMIHFQADQDHPGVTIRASEVKPKLDRFLIRKLQKKDKNYDIEQLKKRYPSFFVDNNHNALNYKMAIEQKTSSMLVELSPTDKKLKKYRYDIYYGNTGYGQEGKKMGVLSDPNVIIFCMVAELRKLIQEYIAEFFIVTNFGTMQNKGFGSFVPKACGYAKILDNKQKGQIADYLLEDVIDTMESKKKCKKACYSICFDKLEKCSKCEKNEYYIRIFKEIKQFYSIMKSGYNFGGDFARSYIYEYMHEKDVDNEKAWMKQQKISPAVTRKGSPAVSYGRQDQNPKYVRAMLGTCGSLSYICNAEIPPSRSNKVSITVSPVKSDISRVPSPIYFKVIRNVVFIVAREVPEEIYGVEFQFENEKWHKKGCLKTPDAFDIDDFLERYVDYYNHSLRDEVGDIRKNRKVEVVKCINISE